MTAILWTSRALSAARRDPRWLQIAFLATFLALGLASRDFPLWHAPLLFAVALGTLVTAANASDHGVRMNEIQLLGSHNSYHRELSFTEKKLQRESDNLWYSHASLPVQFEQESVRQIEIDVIPDSDQGGLYTDPFIRKQAGLGPLTDSELAKPGIKVMHVADYDYNATCSTLVRCLQQVKGWSDTHPDHAPIPILIELKKTDPTLEKLGGVKSPPWDAKQFDRLDNEIRSVLGDEQLILDPLVVPADAPHHVDQQRHDRQERDRAQHLHGRIDQLFAQAEEARNDT